MQRNAAFDIDSHAQQAARSAFDIHELKPEAFDRTIDKFKEFASDSRHQSKPTKPAARKQEQKKMGV